MGGRSENRGLHFEPHDDRYARTAVWLAVVDDIWKRDHVSFAGKYYQVEDSVMQPKPVSKPRPILYAGGESDAAKKLIATQRNAYVMHGIRRQPSGKKMPTCRCVESERDYRE